jgi:hypothetical protein
MVANSSRVRWLEKKAAVLKKRVRQLPPGVRCNKRGSGRRQAVGGEDEVPRTECEEIYRKDNEADAHRYSTRHASISESPETFGGANSFVEFAARARALRSQRRASVSPCAWDA